MLLSEVELVPKDVWTNCTKDSDPKLLNAEDAIVLIGATLLHDIAMHLRPDGFLELVAVTSRFRPLPWFKDEQEDHAADRPWRELWLDYQREARRFSDRDLGNIIGLESVRQGWKFDKLPENTGQWERNHCLIIGEFIRRHHARLAHEIAMYGFPGLDVGSNEGQFPALGEKGNHLQRWADLIGLAARSHGLSLRVCQAYLNQSPIYSDELKPGGSAVFYPMALLRVADYLQIDRQRTPTALLKLRNPQSPISVQEWNKHLAVQRISTSRHNPYSKTITVSQDVSLAVYLQLRDLLAGLQAEMDHATAVLDEVYGRCTDLGLHQLNLATRRIVSNLHSPAFRDNLPYVPERTGFAADPNLLTLLVEPLYGKEPSVGVRELMQNAVDAVRELHAWCETRDIAVESLDLPEQDSDVQIDFIKRDDGTWFLRVTDKGIGMTADTIQNYFLRAGASFRQSKEWSKEFLDEEGKPKVLRAGRFGVGAFAVFLLGSSFRLLTRHAGETKNNGYSVEASADSHLIEICKKEALPVGTVIEVDLSAEPIKALRLDDEKRRFHPFTPGANIDWFCLDWPIVTSRINKGGACEVEIPTQKHRVSLGKSTALNETPPEWSVIYPPDFEKIYWTFSDFPSLVCNGIKIRERFEEFPGNESFDWPNKKQFNAPNIAVFDNGSKLSLTIQRRSLSDKNLPFINELSRDVMLSFIAHSLVCVPENQIEFNKQMHLSYPLVILDNSVDNSLLRWCSTSDATVPMDSWLYTLLKTNTCIFIRTIGFWDSPNGNLEKVYASFQSGNQAILSWRSAIQYPNNAALSYEEERISDVKRLIEDFSKLVENGFDMLSKDQINIRNLVSLPLEPELKTEITEELKTMNGFEIESPNPQRLYFSFQSQSDTDPVAVKKLIGLMELYYKGHKKLDDLLFVAEIQTNSSNSKPETQLAKIWNECLGPKPITFDPIARRDLIEKGRKHPELKIHIEKWEEMKRTGSKWVVGNGKA